MKGYIQNEKHKRGNKQQEKPQQMEQMLLTIQKVHFYQRIPSKKIYQNDQAFVKKVLNMQKKQFAEYYHSNFPFFHKKLIQLEPIIYKQLKQNLDMKQKQKKSKKQFIWKQITICKQSYQLLYTLFLHNEKSRFMDAIMDRISSLQQKSIVNSLNWIFKNMIICQTQSFRINYINQLRILKSICHIEWISLKHIMIIGGQIDSFQPISFIKMISIQSIRFYQVNSKNLKSFSKCRFPHLNVFAFQYKDANMESKAKAVNYSPFCRTKLCTNIAKKHEFIQYAYFNCMDLKFLAKIQWPDFYASGLQRKISHIRKNQELATYRSLRKKGKLNTVQRKSSSDSQGSYDIMDYSQGYSAGIYHVNNIIYQDYDRQLH